MHLNQFAFLRFSILMKDYWRTSMALQLASMSIFQNWLLPIMPNFSKKLAKILKLENKTPTFEVIFITHQHTINKLSGILND